MVYVRDKLKAAGYKVWMDVDNMSEFESSCKSFSSKLIECVLMTFPCKCLTLMLQLCYHGVFDYLLNEGKERKVQGFYVQFKS